MYITGRESKNIINCSGRQNKGGYASKTMQ
jgi:hypothetical protein